MHKMKRLLVCVALVMLCVVGLAAPPASAAPAELRTDVWLPSNPDYGSGTHCINRNIYLTSGDYLWEHYERLLDRTTGGDYSTIDRHQRPMYLRAGDYRWSTCLVYHSNTCTGPGGACPSNAWIQHSTSLTEVRTGGTAYLSSSVRDANYEYITRYGSNLWLCRTEPQC